MIWRLTPLYEQDVNRVVESYDELAKENDDLRPHPRDNLHVLRRVPINATLQSSNYKINSKRNFSTLLDRRQILQLMARASEVESLQKDKEIVLVNLHKAEEEVVVLFEENRFLDEENKTLLLLLESKRLLRSSDSKNSSSASVKINLGMRFIPKY
uniref:Uncharacterized protein n=1 Tax=Ananas comosus var. bracteatus TaxID=296719 RepID=A0A6V7NS23_ANACO|nr:unnamed protein product [Ananas comosus var. bracteatus]